MKIAWAQEMIGKVKDLAKDWVSPESFSEEQIAGFRKAQQTAQNAAKAVAKELKAGWTEKQAADLLNAYLKDSGVKEFFHYSFAWYGERTRFDGIRTYADFSPSSRTLQENEVFILDTAPILDGYICDIGYTGCFGEVSGYNEADQFLKSLREQIPGWVLKSKTGAELWKKVATEIRARGYDTIHQRYPFEVLGHRVHSTVNSRMPTWVQNTVGNFQYLNFGLSSYFELSSRLLWDQLLTEKQNRPIRGLWAVEPHLGTKQFGFKFEEILHVTDTFAEWIGDKEI